MRHARHIAMILLMAILSGCGSRLFHDNFDADTVGAAPNLSPPGDPVGDLIYLSGRRSPAVVVTDSDFTGRSLRYRNSDMDVIERYVGFMSKEIDASSVQYWAAWNGRPNLPNNSSALDIWFGNSHFLPMLVLRFDNGQILLQTGSGATPTYDRIGSFTSGEFHTVIMRVNKDRGTYAVSIASSGPAATSGERAVLNRDALTTLRPTVYMLYSEDVHSSGSYTMDNVLITESCPIEDGGLLRYGSCDM